MTLTEHCWWAGKQDPEHVVFAGYEPCEEIRALWEGRVAIIECSETPIFDGQPSITDGAIGMFPTGLWVAVPKASEMFDHTPNPELIRSEGKMLVDRSLFEKIVLGSKTQPVPESK
jgi:hypothetical protein